MRNISNSNVDPSHLAQLREWFESEWDTVDPFSNTDSRYDIPAPVVATEDGKLLGGLSVTIAPKPESTDVGIWINAVLVATEHRGLGIASRLIQVAESEVKRTGVKELYVFSEFPELYEKLGWQVQVSDGKSKVLQKNLIDD